MSHLPILVPGRTAPVLVPCRLPESVTFLAFLPSRGVREFTLWLTSTDPLKAEVADVQPTNKEGDPRGPDGWTLDEDEARRADDAAADVLGAVIAGLGLRVHLRGPIAVTGLYPRGQDVLASIGKAWDAECTAVQAGTALYHLFLEAKKNTAAEDVYKRVSDLTTPRGQDESAACEALRCYVDAVVDEACVAQADKAEKQAAEWSPVRHCEDVNAEPYEVAP